MLGGWKPPPSSEALRVIALNSLVLLAQAALLVRGLSLDTTEVYKSKFPLASRYKKRLGLIFQNWQSGLKHDPAINTESPQNRSNQSKKENGSRDKSGRLQSPHQDGEQ